MHNVVNDEYFYPSKKSVKHSQAIRFLHVSSFNDEHKNISGMLSAFGQLDRDFILHLITEGEESEVWEARSEEHTSELQSRPHLVCRLLLEKKNKQIQANTISFTVFPEIVPSIGNSFINTMKNINHTRSSISDDTSEERLSRNAETAIVCRF